MRNFQRLLFVLKRSFICYDIICMTVPLIQNNSIALSAYIGFSFQPLALYAKLFILITDDDDNQR